MSWYPVEHVLLEVEPCGLLEGELGGAGGTFEGSCDIIETGGEMTTPGFWTWDVCR